jgi:hypothetical protein
MELTTIFSKPTMVRSNQPSYLMRGPNNVKQPTLTRSKTSSSLSELDSSNHGMRMRAFTEDTYKKNMVRSRKRAKNSSVYTFIHSQRRVGVVVRLY